MISTFFLSVKSIFISFKIKPENMQKASVTLKNLEEFVKEDIFDKSDFEVNVDSVNHLKILFT